MDGNDRPHDEGDDLSTTRSAGVAESLGMVVVKELLEADRFAAHLGARLVEVETDRVVVEMDVHEYHRDPSRAVSAGALFSLADCAMSLISNAGGRAVAVATHFTVSERPTDVQSVRAVARPVLADGGRATTWHVSLLCGTSPVASFTGTTMRID